jgi:hypothetical protein
LGRNRIGQLQNRSLLQRIKPGDESSTRPTPDKKLAVLLLSHVGLGDPRTTHDHERALAGFSGHDVHVHDPRLSAPAMPDLADFDAVVIHYSIVIFRDDHLPESCRQAIQAFDGLKCLFIQDEYRSISAAVGMMERLGINVLFSCLPIADSTVLYGPLARRGVRIEPTLPGYVPAIVPEDFAVPFRERTLDVVYRGRIAPFALGRLGQERVRIAREFTRRARGLDLRCDIALDEESRIYGDEWLRFLAASRASLGAESGASIADATGDIHRAVEALLAQRPEASFAEVEAELLAPFEGNHLLRALSPRIFEAASVRNTLVLFPGNYSGVLQEGRHYIRLEKDFSNLAQVVDQIGDTSHLEALAERAYADLVESGRYALSAFSAEVDRILSREWRARIERPRGQAPVRIGAGGPRRGPRPGDTEVLSRNLPSQIRASGDWTQAGAQVVHADRSVRIVAPDIAYHYAACAPLDLTGVDVSREACWLRITTEGVWGEMLVALYDEQTDTLGLERPLRLGPGRRQTLIELVDPPGSMLMFRNGGQARGAAVTFLGAELIGPRRVQRLAASFDPASAIVHEPWREAGAERHVAGRGLRLRTPSQPWSYTAVILLDFSGVDFASETARLQIAVSDIQGEPRLSLFDPERNEVSGEVIVRQDMASVTIEFAAPAGSMVLIRNGAADQVSSLTLGDIHLIAIETPSAPA